MKNSKSLLKKYYMKIRLILPICNNSYNKWWHCKNAFLNKRNRLNILQKAMCFKSNDIDLVVTSNNFFGLNDKSEIRLKGLINSLKCKKDLIIGVDFPKRTNPFDGICAKVFYFQQKNKQYILRQSIWEVYHSSIKKNNKTLDNFKKQSRTIKVKNKSITLLSCGDILKDIHQGKKGLSNTNIYISLAHIDFKNYLINYKQHISNIQNWMGSNKIVLVTQQLSDDKLNNGNFFSKSKKYKLIYPKDLFLSQNIYFFKNYIFIDIKI